MDLFLIFNINFVHSFSHPPPLLFLTPLGAPTPIIFNPTRTYYLSTAPHPLQSSHPSLLSQQFKVNVYNHSFAYILSSFALISSSEVPANPQLWLNPTFYFLCPCTYAAQSGRKKDSNHTNYSHFQFMITSFKRVLHVTRDLTISPRSIHSATILRGDFLFPFSSTFSHLLPHPHSQVILLPISLKKMEQNFY